MNGLTQPMHFHDGAGRRKYCDSGPVAEKRAPSASPRYSPGAAKNAAASTGAAAPTTGSPTLRMLKWNVTNSGRFGSLSAISQAPTGRGSPWARMT